MQLKKIQKHQVVKQLRRYKRVTRNWALQRGITRLSSYICSMSKEGWMFETPDPRNCGDFRYIVIKMPKLSTDKDKYKRKVKQTTV